MKKRVLGLFLIAIGIGILITLSIPKMFWAFVIAIVCVGAGIFLLKC